MKQNTDATDAINASQTNADVHGRTKIKPGDRVKFSRNWARVVEVDRDNNKLKVFEEGIGSEVETRFARDVVGYKPRD